MVVNRENGDPYKDDEVELFCSVGAAKHHRDNYANYQSDKKYVVVKIRISDIEKLILSSKTV